MAKYSLQRRSLWMRAQEAYRTGGTVAVLRSGLNLAFLNRVEYSQYRRHKSATPFTFQGRAYTYFYHRHNTTWRNERAVEVPIVWEIVKNHAGKKILEVGNVLSHYFPCSHDVLDRYEEGEHIIHEDAVDFQPPVRYDLIVSISTLEHVGWDETPKDPGKIGSALERLTSCLAPGGRMVVTLPLGYNPEMDRQLENGNIRFTRANYLQRVSKDNRWIESDWKRVRIARDERRFPNTNGLIIGVMEAR